MASNELAVIIPVYNESEGIQAAITQWVNELQRLNIDFCCHVYDDGSHDDTLAILQAAAAANPRVKAYHHANMGHGPTILRGYREQCDAEWILQIDGDNEIDALEFESFWKQRERYDILVGNRIDQKCPLIRKVITWISRRTVYLFYGTGIHHVNCGFRLMRTSAFREYFAKIPEGTLTPNVILTGIASQKNLRRCSIPVRYHPRTTGKSSFRKLSTLLKFVLRSFVQVIRFRFSRY